MSDIQQTNIAVANFIIDELHKDKPFNLMLEQQQADVFFLAVEGFQGDLRLSISHKSGITTIEVDDGNADAIYQMLSSYIAKHEQSRNTIDSFINDGGFNQAFKDVFGLPDSVKQSLKEVS
ncbi:hypothetical protein ACNGTW_02390 [Acinetobacter radioresistens]|uniref:hypothetical protein n=1 Tax=Acinetobacter radioresistens TaxID=40216 RepID=UPI003A806FA9